MIRKPAKRKRPVRLDPLVLEQVRAGQPWPQYGSGRPMLRTQTAFAQALGITERTLRRWETNGTELERDSATFKRLRELATEAEVELLPKPAALKKLRAERAADVKRRAQWYGSRRLTKRHG